MFLVVQGADNVFARLSRTKDDVDQAEQACLDLGLVWPREPFWQALGNTYP